MLRGYRCILIALVGWLSLAATADPHAQPKESATQQSIAKSLSDISTTLNEQAERAERAPETQPCASGDDHRDSDLCAQWKAADAADRAALFGGISILGIALAIGLTIQSNNIARDTAKRQLRAYIAVSDSQIRPDPIDANKVQAIIEFTNLGETPAIDVSAAIYILFGDNAFDDSRLRTEPQLPFGPSVTVIGKGVKKHSTVSSQAPGLSAPTILSGDFNVTIYGQILYADVFGSRQETKFCHYVDQSTRMNGLVIANAPTGNSMT